MWKERAIKYAKNIGTWISQTANTFTGGDPDETLSSRMGKKRKRCRVCNWICHVLDWIDPGHCKAAVEKDEGDDEVLGI